MAAAEKSVAQDASKHEMLAADLYDAKLKLYLTDVKRKKILNDDKKVAATVSNFSEIKSELKEVTEKHDKFKGKLRAVETESGRRLIRLNKFLVK